MDAGAFPQSLRSLATAAGTEFNGQVKLLPAATTTQPAPLCCSTIVPVAATAAHARESLDGQASTA